MMFRHYRIACLCCRGRIYSAPAASIAYPTCDDVGAEPIQYDVGAEYIQPLRHTARVENSVYRDGLSVAKGGNNFSLHKRRGVTCYASTGLPVYVVGAEHILPLQHKCKHR